MAVVAIAIRADSAGPVLFRQKRVGHAGKPITVYKFRTMRQIEVEDERSAAMTSATTTASPGSADSLRKLRIDELPQIINILNWRDELDRPAAGG